MIKTFKYLNLIFFIVMVGINALANMLPIGHGNTGAISSKYPNLFTPAPITFSIWGVIYLLTAFFIFYQFGLLNRVAADRLVEVVGIWFVLSCIMNIGWIFSWHYDVIWLSMIFIVGLLFTLIMIAMNLTPITLAGGANEDTVPKLVKLCIYAFDIYLGWISVATIANMSVFLVKIEWDRFGLSEVFWMICILIVGTILGILFIFANQRYMSALVVIWAYCGILIKHISKSGYNGSYPLIIFVAVLGVLLIIAAGIIRKSMPE